MEDVQNPTPQKNGSLSTFIVIGEIMSIIILICFIFVCLHFFRVINLQLAFPFLSFLPQEPAQLQQNRQAAITKKPPFVYDQAKATNSLQPFILSHVKSAFQPSSINIKQTLSVENGNKGAVYTFGTKWTKEDNDFFGLLNFNPDSNDITDMSIAIISRSPRTIDISSLSDLLSTYFQGYTLNPMTCQQGSGSTTNFNVCEHFYTDNGIKKGIGAIVTRVKDAITISALFGCEIPQKSTHYGWKSCTEQLKDSGTK